jgi:hypothetical protein
VALAEAIREMRLAVSGDEQSLAGVEDSVLSAAYRRARAAR